MLEIEVLDPLRGCRDRDQWASSWYVPTPDVILRHLPIKIYVSLKGLASATANVLATVEVSSGLTGREGDIDIGVVDLAVAKSNRMSVCW